MLSEALKKDILLMKKTSRLLKTLYPQNANFARSDDYWLLEWADSTSVYTICLPDDSTLLFWTKANEEGTEVESVDLNGFTPESLARLIIREAKGML